MTPQTQLTLSKLFDGKEIRVEEQDNDFWMIVADLTKAWDLHRNTLNDIIGRNEWKFGGHYTTVARGACAGMIAVNETGMYLLMGAVHINLVKNEKAKNAIKKFNQEWPELVKAFRKGEVVQVPQSRQGTLDCVNHYLDLADIAIKRSNVPKEIAHGQAWALAGTETKIEMVTAVAGYIKTQPKQLLLTEAGPTDQAEFDSHFSLGYIAGVLKLSEDKTRNILETMNIICYKNRMWHLTTFGEQYGKPFKVVIGHPYRSIQQTWIRYNPELIKLLRREYHIETKVSEV